jgi:hypothetical protein
MNKIDTLTNKTTIIFEHITNNSNSSLYWYSYIFGIIALLLVDSSIILDDIMIFGIFSFFIAPMIGYLILLTLIVTNGIIGIFNDIYKKLILIF